MFNLRFAEVNYERIQSKKNLQAIYPVLEEAVLCRQEKTCLFDKMESLSGLTGPILFPRSLIGEAVGNLVRSSIMFNSRDRDILIKNSKAFLQFAHLMMLSSRKDEVVKKAV